MWFNYGENQKVRKVKNGYEFVEAVWLDTCPYDAEKEWCVCHGIIEDENLSTAADKFMEECLDDSYCIKGECNKKDAMNFIEKYIKEN